MTSKDLTELEKLEAKATPSPWVGGRNTYDGNNFKRAEMLKLAKDLEAEGY